VAVFLIGILYNCVSWAKLRAAILRRSPSDASARPGAVLTLTVLVPVRDEQRAVDGSVAYFTKWLLGAPDGVDARVVYISATDRDACDPRTTRSKTGAAIARSIAAHDGLEGRLIHLHCPNSTTSKANQINWAVNHLFQDSVLNEADHLLGFYDVDARPPVRTFAELDAACSTAQRPPECLQQLTVYFSARGRKPNATL
jgi:hypothetical protein